MKDTEKKPKYEFDVQGHYAHGWETVTCESTRKEALDRVREYYQCESGVAFRIKPVKAT